MGIIIIHDFVHKKENTEKCPSKVHLVNNLESSDPNQGCLVPEAVLNCCPVLLSTLCELEHISPY